MTFFFLKDIFGGLFTWLNAKRLMVYFLMQGDIIIILLAGILFYEVKRWNKIKNRY